MVTFGYTILYVQDLEKAVTFYEAAFGFKLRFIMPNEYAELETGSTALGFITKTLGNTHLKKGFIESSLANQPFGIELALVTNELDEVIEKVIANGGVLVEPPVKKPWGQTMAYVRDLDGFLIELSYDTVIQQCQDIFEKKTKDYGTAWRILRLPSLTDQMMIKAQRIRTIQEKGQQRVAEPIEVELIGIINYSIMAIMQIKLPLDTPLEVSCEELVPYYSQIIQATKSLLGAKNHDYDEAWKSMRLSSIIDIILMKLLRIKRIEDNQGTTLISEDATMFLRSRSFVLLLKALTGGLFIFSGLIKLNDPLGFSVTIGTYFKALAADVSSVLLHLIPYSLWVAIGVCVIEVMLGLALLINFQTKWTLRFLWLLTGFFTGLTLYTLWLQRVNSCGCFSEAIPLTPTQSFLKNLLILITLYLVHKHRILPSTPLHQPIKFIVLALTANLSTWLGIYTYRHLPLIDFGPYPIGTLIQTSIPSKFIENETQQEANNHLQVPRFIVWDQEKEITSELLQGTQLLCIIQTTLSEQAQRYVLDLSKKWHSATPLTWLLPLHLEQEVLPHVNKKHMAWAADHLLRSILKADKGFILLQDGQIIGKWNYRDADQLDQKMPKDFRS
eukprot:gene339-431_t